QAAEVCRERKTGFRAESVLAAVFGKFGDMIRDARILPHDGVRYGLASLAIPDDGGLALVGDADGREVVGMQAAKTHRFGDDVLGAAPDFFGIMLHPTGLRVDLLMLLLRGSDDSGRAVKNDEARAGSALIERADVAGWRHSGRLGITPV